MRADPAGAAVPPASRSAGRLGPVAVGLDSSPGDSDGHVIPFEVFQDLFEAARKDGGGFGLIATQSHMTLDRVCTAPLHELRVQGYQHGSLLCRIYGQVVVLAFIGESGVKRSADPSLYRQALGRGRQDASWEPDWRVRRGSEGGDP
jgi:hypothetical protein